MDPEVVKAMEPFLTEGYGNPSGLHWAGIPAREAVENARGRVADLLGCKPGEVVFTSGGTEANNYALKGTFFALRERGNHIITSIIEHPSILEPCRFLESLGVKVTYLPVDETGLVDPEDVRRAITDKTILVSIMHANNEVGTIQPIIEISKITKEHGIRFHTDSAQSVGKIPTRVSELGVDLLSVAGHKVYGPKGVGALYVREGTELTPFHHGAGHELGRRAGTENVLLNVGLGKACEVARSFIGMEAAKELRDRFYHQLKERFGDRCTLNGHPTERLPNTLNVNFVGQVGSEILAKLEGVAASTGSACHAGSVELSPVLKAMGVPEEAGMGAIRFSLGRGTTQEDIDYLLSALEKVIV